MRSKEEVLNDFIQACNTPDTLFVTDHWIFARLEQLYKLMADPPLRMKWQR